MSLDARQKKFAKEYAESLNMYQSAINAGYSASYAKSSSYKLLDIVGMRDEIERIRADEQDKVQKRFAIGASKAIKWMLEAIDDDDVPPTVKQTITKNLLDYAGFKPINKQEVEHSGDMNVNNPFVDLTTEELRKLADADGDD